MLNLKILIPFYKKKIPQNFYFLYFFIIFKLTQKREYKGKRLRILEKFM